MSNKQHLNCLFNSEIDLLMPQLNSVNQTLVSQTGVTSKTKNLNSDHAKLKKCLQDRRTSNNWNFTGPALILQDPLPKIPKIRYK